MKNIGRFGKIKYLHVFERLPTAKAVVARSGMVKLLAPINEPKATKEASEAGARAS